MCENFLKRITGWLGVVLFSALFVLSSQPVLAKNVCESITGTSDPEDVVTFEMTTDSNWLTRNYVTLKGKKGTMHMQGIDSNNGDKYVKKYGIYEVTVINKENDETQTYTMKGKKLKIKNLAANTSYTVTVRPYGSSNQAELDALTLQGKRGAFDRWSKNARWSTQKTSGVIFCEEES